jgi:hypothetical protein
MIGNPAMADSAPLEDKIVELPVLWVEEKVRLPPRENWRYCAIPDFEILSELSDKDTRALIRDLQTSRQVGEHVWPIKIKTDRLITLVFCRNARSFADFGIDEWFRKNTKYTRNYSDTVSDWEHLFKIWDASYLLKYKSWTRMSHTHGLRWHLIEPQPPLWMTAIGASFLYFYCDIENEDIIVGKRSGSVDSDLTYTSRNSRSGRLAQIPSLGKSFVEPSPTRGKTIVVHERNWHPLHKYAGVQEVSLFSLHAFTHMCLLNKPERYEAAFSRFITRARLEPLSGKLFEECFGKSIQKLEKETIDFQDRVYHTGIVPVKTIKAKLEYTPIELRDATDAEVGRIKGEALALLPNPKITPRLMLRAPYVRGERDPKLLAAIGLHERKIGNDAEALRFLEEAVRQKVDRPRAYIELAQMYYSEARKKPEGDDGRLGANQINPIMALLDEARGLPQKIPEVYDVIAEVCANTEVSAMRDYLGVIDEGLAAFPFHAELFCQGAAAFAHAGHVKEAEKLIAYGLSRFRYYEPGYRERLEQLKSTLPLPPPFAEKTNQS